MLKIWKSIFVIILLSALGAGLWLYEIVKVIIWNNLAWVHERLYSAFLGSFLAAYSFLAPFFIEKQLSFKNAVISVTILTVANVVCYGQGKELCYDANSYLYLMEVRLDLIMKLVLHAIGLYIFIGIVYWLITNLFIKKNKKINSVLITVLLLLAMPLSFVTIQINPGFGHGTAWVDVVKMGYPVFWTIFFLGLAGIIITTQKDLT